MWVFFVGCLIGITLWPRVAKPAPIWWVKIIGLWPFQSHGTCVSLAIRLVNFSWNMEYFNAPYL